MTVVPAKKPPLLTPIVRWFMVAMVLANIASSMSPMLLPIYLNQMGASVAQVGLVYTITSVVVLILQIMGGWISDSIGRLRAIAIGSVGGIIGFVALLVAPTWQWMLAAMAIYQIPFALVGPSFSAFIAENSREEDRGKVYGITNTIYSITGVVGPALGGYLVGLYSFKMMLGVGTVFYIAAAGLRMWMATTMKSAGEKATGELSIGSFKASIKTLVGMMVGGGILTWLLLSDSISDISFRLSDNLSALYLEKVGLITVAQIGIMASINAIAGMFVPLLSGRMVDRYGERIPLISGFFCCFLALVTFVSAHSYPMFILSWIIFGVGGGMLGPAYQSLISKIVPSRLLGTFSGVFYSSVGLFSLPAPWLGAQIWEKFTPQTPFIFTAIASLTILPIIWFKFRLPKDRIEPPAPVELKPEPQTGD